jgi:hypothetical protein
MLLRDYHNPSDEELEAGFREVYHFIQKFTTFEKVLVWLICRVMGDRIYRLVVQREHQITMRTLQDVAVGMHSEFFERKRVERAKLRNEAKGFIPSTVVE